MQCITTSGIARIIGLLVPFVAASQSIPPPGANRPPSIGASLGARTWIPPWTPVHFTLTFTDPEGDAVSARAVSAPPDFVFEPFAKAPSGTSRSFAWYPRQEHSGLQTLIVETWDAAPGAERVRREFDFEVVGLPWFGTAEGARARALAANLDLDPELELLAAATVDRTRSAAYGRFDVSAAPPMARVQHGSALLLAGNPPPAGTAPFEQLVDVTGDGRRDLVAAQNSTRVLVWKGGPSVMPGTSERAVLESADVVGPVLLETRVTFSDLDLDGIQDVIVPFGRADIAGVRDAGEIRIFRGGPSLRGTPAPWSTLRPSAPQLDERFGGAFSAALGDVTGDGRADVAVLTSLTDVAGSTDAGCVYVYDGSALAGTPAPKAVLVAGGPVGPKKLGDTPWNLGFFTVDVTGDGVLDIVAGAASTTTYSGSIHVWSGGPALAGTVPSTAQLVPSIGADARLFSNRYCNQALAFADVDADSILDVIVGSPYAKVAGSAEAGALFVWRGGPMSGSTAETALLRLASPKPAERLTRGPWTLQLVDVTADGVVDVVTGSQDVDTSASTGDSEGAIHVWHGRAGFAGVVHPSASLEVPAGRPDDHLTGMDDGDVAAGLIIDDVTGDGLLDIIGAAPDVNEWADSPPFQGAVYVWQGGPALATSGVTAPLAELTHPTEPYYMYLGFRAFEWGASVRRVDWNGDGIRDLIPCQSGFSWYGLRLNGRALAFLGGPTLVGSPPAFTVFDGGSAGDVVIGGDGLLLDDVNGDGWVDLLASGASPPGSPSNWGAVVAFAGGPTAQGVLPWFAALTSPFPDGSFVSTLNGITITADVDADGVSDVVIADDYADAGADETGALFWYRGPISAKSAPYILNVPLLGAKAHLGQ